MNGDNVASYNSSDLKPKKRRRSVFGQLNESSRNNKRLRRTEIKNNVSYERQKVFDENNSEGANSHQCNPTDGVGRPKRKECPTEGEIINSKRRCLVSENLKTLFKGANKDKQKIRRRQQRKKRKVKTFDPFEGYEKKGNKMKNKRNTKDNPSSKESEPKTTSTTKSVPSSKPTKDQTQNKTMPNHGSSKKMQKESSPISEKAKTPKVHSQKKKSVAFTPKTPSRSSKNGMKNHLSRTRQSARLLKKQRARIQDHKNKRKKEQKMLDDKQVLRDKIGPSLRRSCKYLSVRELIDKFAPRNRLKLSDGRNKVRSTLKRTMAKYHPDKHCNKESLEAMVEAEEIFHILQEAYSKFK
eukprot:jgi/Bigna1/78458/fgenesh1_pg.55_\